MINMNIAYEFVTIYAYLQRRSQYFQGGGELGGGG